MSRELGAGLLAGIGDLLGIADAGEAIDLFDRMTDEQVEAARSWLAPRRPIAPHSTGSGQGRG